jgi:hypothetical protein
MSGSEVVPRVPGWILTLALGTATAFGLNGPHSERPPQDACEAKSKAHDA